MDKELERHKSHIIETTGHLEMTEYIELLRELSVWASSTAGMLEYEAPDIDDYDE